MLCLLSLSSKMDHLASYPSPFGNCLPPIPAGSACHWALQMKATKQARSIASSIDRAADEALVAAANNGDESAFAFGEAPSCMV